MSFGNQKPANQDASIAQTEPDWSEFIFRPGYVFDAETYNIENNPPPFVEPSVPIPAEPSWVDVPPLQEPTPAATSKLGTLGEKWFGPLFAGVVGNLAGSSQVIQLPNGGPIRSLYIPYTLLPIAIYAGYAIGNPIVIAQGGGVAQLIPLPPGIHVITIEPLGSGGPTGGIYVLATEIVWPPFSRGGSQQNSLQELINSLAVYHWYKMNDLPSSDVLIDYAPVFTLPGSAANGSPNGSLHLGGIPICADGMSTYQTDDVIAGSSSSESIPSTGAWSILCFFRATQIHDWGGLNVIFSNQRYDPPPGISTGGFTCVMIESGPVPEILLVLAKTPHGLGAYYSILFSEGVSYDSTHMIFMGYDGVNFYGALDLQPMVVVPTAGDYDGANGACAFGWQPTGGQNSWAGEIAHWICFEQILTQQQLDEFYSLLV